MRRGGKPKPTYMRLLEGNAGKRPMNHAEPKPTQPLAEPPASLSDRQKDIWRYALEHAPIGLLTSLDESVFKVWVIACDFHDQANTMVNTAGIFMRTKQGVPIQNPWMAVVNRQSLIMMRAAAEMGFTPSSRSRVQVENQQTASAFSALKDID